MSEEKEITLSVNEQNWAIYHWCGIPYQEVKKIDDPEERKFLLGMAVYMKSEHEEKINTKIIKTDYLYPRLDQYELYDQLDDLPTVELKKIKKSQLKYPWKLDEVIKNRT